MKALAIVGMVLATLFLVIGMVAAVTAPPSPEEKRRQEADTAATVEQCKRDPVCYCMLTLGAMELAGRGAVNASSEQRDWCQAHTDWFQHKVTQ
jgi:hypothetical protein